MDEFDVVVKAIEPAARPRLFSTSLVAGDVFEKTLDCLSRNLPDAVFTAEQLVLLQECCNFSANAGFSSRLTTDDALAQHRRIRMAMIEALEQHVVPQLAVPSAAQARLQTALARKPSLA